MDTHAVPYVSVISRISFSRLLLLQGRLGFQTILAVARKGNAVIFNQSNIKLLTWAFHQ